MRAYLEVSRAFRAVLAEVVTSPRPDGPGRLAEATFAGQPDGGSERRRIGERCGRTGGPVSATAEAAGCLLRRCRTCRGVQRPARRGALFTAEILICSISLRVMLPTLACSWIATATAWVYLPNRAAYVGIPDYRFSGSLMTFALLADPLVGLISAGYFRLIGLVSHHRTRGTKALCAPVIAFGLLRGHRHLVSASVRQPAGYGPATRSSASADWGCSWPSLLSAAGHCDVPG